MAVPTKGAEQGVAIKVAKKPLKKSFKKDLLFKFAQATLKDETSKMKRVSGA